MPENKNQLFGALLALTAAVVLAYKQTCKPLTALVRTPVPW